jgi:hypothetical protein
MKRLIYIVVCVAAVACCPCRKVGATASVIESVRDSVYVQRIDTLRVVERDTIHLAPINQWHNSVSLAASYSFLENEYCTSSASVDSVGVLTHTLDTRDSATMPVRIREVYKLVVDSVYVSKDAEAQSTQVTTIEHRVKHITWWQRTQIVALWVLVAVIVIKYRKIIIKVISGWRI